MSHLKRISQTLRDMDYILETRTLPKGWKVEYINGSRFFCGPSVKENNEGILELDNQIALRINKMNTEIESISIRHKFKRFPDIIPFLIAKK